MDKKTRYYVSSKNVLTWLMALCMVCSAVARIFFGVKGTDPWSQIVLPVTAALLYALIALLSGKELFYKTAIPVWLISLYHYFYFSGLSFGSYQGLLTWLFAIALLFIALMYTVITCGKFPHTWLLLPLEAVPGALQLYLLRYARVNKNLPH